MAAKRRTPLRIGQHPALAFEASFDIVGAVLSRQLDDLEPRLMRHGYDVRALVGQFHPNP